MSANPAPHPVAPGRRPLPGGGPSVSAVAMSVEPVGATAGDRTIALLQRAHRAGVTTFDVSGARNPALGLQLVRRAFADSEGPLEVLIDLSPERLLGDRTEPATGAQASEGVVYDELRRVRERVPGRTTVIALLPPPRIPSAGALFATAVRRAVDDRLLQAFARRCPAPGRLPEAEEARGTADSGTFAGALSLLEPELVGPMRDRAALGPAALIALDPFAAGRLDGSAFSAALGTRTPDRPPPTVRALHEAFDPVLRLGFLTEGTSRSLAQAALRFVTQWSWVATVVIPMPTPERFDEMLAAASTPAISEAELERIAAICDGVAAPRAGPGA